MSNERGSPLICLLVLLNKGWYTYTLEPIFWLREHVEYGDRAGVPDESPALRNCGTVCKTVPEHCGRMFAAK
jgi:hypothetical protein